MTHTAYRPFAAESLGYECHAVPCAHLFISLYLLGPTDNTDPPTSPQMRPFPLKWEAENIHTVSHAFCPSFFLFRRRALGFQPIKRRVCWTPLTVPRACRAKRFGPRTQLCRSLSNCPNQVCEVNVRQIKNELSLPNLFQVRWTPQTRFAKQIFIQLRTGLIITTRTLCCVHLCPL